MKTSRTSLAARVALAGLTLVVMVPTGRAYEQYSLNRDATNCRACHGDFRAVPYNSAGTGGTWTGGLHDTHRNVMLSGDCGACHLAAGRFPVLIAGPSTSAAPFNTACLGCHGRAEGNAGLTGRGLRQHHQRAGETICLSCHADAALTGFPVVAESVKPPLYITDVGHPNLPKDPCNLSPTFLENFAGTTQGLDNDGNGLSDAADPSCVATAPTIDLSPNSLTFGSVNVGTTSPAQTSAIQNTGTAVLTVTAIARCVGTSAEFAFSAPAVPFNVAAGGSANLSVTYAPTAAGADSGCVAVTSNASNGPTTNLALSGTGVAAPRIAVAPTTLALGNVTVGTSGTQTFAISNTGNATLTGSAALGTGTSTEFTFAPATFSIAAGGAPVTVTATYTPTAVGADSGSIVVSSNDIITPNVSVAVSGSGVAAPAPKIAVTPTTLPFGNVTVGTSGTQTFAISNTGNATLTGTIARGGVTSTEFTFSPASFSIVAGGAPVTVTATYTPTAAGADTGSIVVSSNDATNPAVSVTVSGTGVTAPAPVIALVPSSLSFGTVTLPGSASLTTQVQNTGNALLTVSAITLGAGTSSEFTWSPAAPITVAAGGSSTVTVTYTPTNAGTDSGTIVFTSNASNGPTTSLSVTGTGQAAAAPRIAVAPLSLAFGNVTAGTTSAAQTFTVSNTGTATLTGTIAPPGGTSNEFTLSPASFSIAAGGAPVTVSVAYAPTAVGADSGNLVVSSNDTTNPTVNVAVSGTGVAAPTPSIALVPNTLSFGNVTLGGSSSLNTAVRNTGTATLTVSAIARCTGTSAEFTFTPPAVPFDVLPGASASVGVTYSPADLGTDSGCINFSSNDPASPTVSLGVTGTGVAQQVPAIAVSPTSLDFGTVTIGGSASRTTTVQNAGTGPLNVTGISLGSRTSMEYSWSPAAPFSVAAGQSVTLTVTYQPIDASTDTGSIVIASNDPVNPSVNVSLTGTGSPPVVGGVDIDIHELDVPERVSFQKPRVITPEAEVVNHSKIDGSATMTLVGVLNGVEVYRQVGTVFIKAGREAELKFPPYTPDRLASGTIIWTLTLQDEDPDVDQATARTALRTRGGVDRGDRDERGEKAEGEHVAHLDSASVIAEGAASGGCSNGGSAGWLALVALALLAAGRRREVRRSCA
jgi:Abnormal spindle-like microcephaly-assoc'd, ASPM-SPD-2-Hydin